MPQKITDFKLSAVRNNSAVDKGQIHGPKRCYSFAISVKNGNEGSKNTRSFLHQSMDESCANGPPTTDDVTKGAQELSTTNVSGH